MQCHEVRAEAHDHPAIVGHSLQALKDAISVLQLTCDISSRKVRLTASDIAAQQMERS